MDFQTEKSSPLICQQRVNGDKQIPFPLRSSTFCFNGRDRGYCALVTTILEHHVQDFEFMIHINPTLDGTAVLNGWRCIRAQRRPRVQLFRRKEDDGTVDVCRGRAHGERIFRKREKSITYDTCAKIAGPVRLTGTWNAYCIFPRQSIGNI